MPNEQSPHPAPRRIGFPTIAIIFLLSLALRMIFLHQTLQKNTLAEIIHFNWDSREYVHLAVNLLRRSQFVYDINPIPAAIQTVPPQPIEPATVSHFFGLLRTPGYPMFCAAIVKTFGTWKAILWTQAVLGSLIPVIVLLLGNAMLQSRGAAIAAAIVSMISPTGIGLSGIFLVDLLFALCVIGGFGLLYLGTLRGRWLAYIGAGTLFAGGILLKPALLYWPIALIPVAALFLLANNRQVNWRHAWKRVAVTAFIPYLAVWAWCGRNLVVEHSFTFCSVDSQNLRHFLAPLTEEWAKAGHAPDAGDIWKNHYAVRNKDWDDMQCGRVTPVELRRRQRSDALDILRRHPLLAMRCLLVCSTSTCVETWPYTRDQLTDGSVLRTTLFGIDGVRNHGGIVFVVMFIGLFEPLITGKRLRDPDNRRRCFMNLALFIVFTYFVILVGTSFSTGFRLLYPAEFSMILLIASGFLACGRILRRAVV